MRLLTAADLVRVLPLKETLAPIRTAFRAITEQQGVVAERQALPLAGGTGLVMAAALPGQGLAGKLVSVVPGNAERGLPGTLGLLLLMDDATGEPLALMDGAEFTALRTAAVSACATDLLARPGARVATLFGCGTQARAQLDGLVAVRQLDEIRVVGHAAGDAAAFVAAHQPVMAVTLVALDDARAALEGSDIVVTATNSAHPVFSADALEAGAHVAAIGSFRPGMIENDPALAARCQLFVESRDTAQAEAGELIAAAEQGLTQVADWTEIGEVLAGSRPGRTAAGARTLFKSVGHALFDLVLARAAWERAQAEGLGTEWSP